MTNKAVTGKTKAEWAREWGIPVKNLNLRDHMTPDGSAQAQLLLHATRTTLRLDPSLDSRETHKKKCEAAAFLMEGLETVSREPQQSVPYARAVLRDGAAIKDTPAPAPPPVQVANDNHHGSGNGNGNHTNNAPTTNNIYNYFSGAPPAATSS